MLVAILFRSYYLLIMLKVRVCTGLQLRTQRVSQSFGRLCACDVWRGNDGPMSWAPSCMLSDENLESVKDTKGFAHTGADKTKSPLTFTRKSVNM